MSNTYTFPDGTVVDFGNRDPQEVLDAYYGEIDTTEFMASGDTPEDAACKLLIMLLKQGVLHAGN